MIDEYGTYLKFGYKSTDLKKNSHKKVIVICNECRESRESRMSHVSEAKSGKCSRCSRLSKHSPETKYKIGQSNLKAISEGRKKTNKGIPKPESFSKQVSINNSKRVWKEESRIKLSNSHKNKVMSESSRKKMSEGRMGEKNHMFGKPAYNGKGTDYIRKNGEKIWLRSSWEFKIAEYLDNNKYNWIYEPFAYNIDYYYNDVFKKGTFRPDFKVWKEDENDYEIWEIKGYWRDDAKCKFTAFLDKYSSEFTIKLFEKKELISLGIDLRRKK